MTRSPIKPKTTKEGYYKKLNIGLERQMNNLQQDLRFVPVDLSVAKLILGKPNFEYDFGTGDSQVFDTFHSIISRFILIPAHLRWAGRLRSVIVSDRVDKRYPTGH